MKVYKILLKTIITAQKKKKFYFQYLIEKDTSIWWAGKELLRGKLLKDFVGKNEKTKIVKYFFNIISNRKK